MLNTYSRTIYIYIYTYIHTYTYTHTHTKLLLGFLRRFIGIKGCAIDFQTLGLASGSKYLRVYRALWFFRVLGL